MIPCIHRRVVSQDPAQNEPCTDCEEVAVWRCLEALSRQYLKATLAREGEPALLRQLDEIRAKRNPVVIGTIDVDGVRVPVKYDADGLVTRAQTASSLVLVCSTCARKRPVQHEPIPCARGMCPVCGVAIAVGYPVATSVVEELREYRATGGEHVSSNPKPVGNVAPTAEAGGGISGSTPEAGTTPVGIAQATYAAKTGDRAEASGTEPGRDSPASIHGERLRGFDDCERDVVDDLEDTAKAFDLDHRSHAPGAAIRTALHRIKQGWHRGRSKRSTPDDGIQATKPARPKYARELNIGETLRELRRCAASWEPRVRLIGNVQAGDIVAAIDEGGW